jgi:hypothetical protein
MIYICTKIMLPPPPPSSPPPVPAPPLDKFITNENPQLGKSKRKF